MRTVIWLMGLVLVGCGLNPNDPFRDRPTVSLVDAPPPISGGTLEVSQDGRYAVISDPDLDRVLRVDLSTREVREVSLPADTEPGRIAEDRSGRVYVALRQSGEVAELHLERAELVRQISVCAAPRGLAFSDDDRIHVACASGELVTLGPEREVTQRLMLASDLSDVVVVRDGLLVSRFLTAEVIRVGGEGSLGVSSLPLATLTGIDEDGGRTELQQRYRSGVAVRMRPSQDGGALVLHQRARVGPEEVFRRRTTPPSRSSYTYSNRPVTHEDITWRDPCGNAVMHAATSIVDARGEPRGEAPSIPGGVVPVDVAVSAGGRVAVAFAGEPGGEFRYGPQVFESSVARLQLDAGGGCLEGDGDQAYPGQAVALAYAGDTLLVQLRAPAGLMIGDRHVALGGPSTRDSGHEIFHLDTGGGVACASCHPGGGDDGHIWDFAAVTPVRTLPLAGTVAMAPYHRAGDVPTFEELMGLLADQMAGPRLEADSMSAIRTWLERLPSPATGPTVDTSAIQRGELVFQRAGCSECHIGESGSDGESHPVGGASWQTPTLYGLALRAPYLHDGSAATLEESLLGAYTGEHGDLRAVSDEAHADLLTYLRSR